MNSRTDDGSTVGIGDLATVAIAGLVGAVAAGLVFRVGNPGVLRSVGALVGADSLTAGWLTLLVLGALLGGPFLAFVAWTLEGFVDRVIALTSRSDALRRVLVPLLLESALGVTLFALGLLYGFVVGTVGFGLVAPAWTIVVAGEALPVPHVDPVAILGWTTYGGLMGLGYGLVEDR